jgi:hypothetical protein
MMAGVAVLVVFPLFGYLLMRALEGRPEEVSS